MSARSATWANGKQRNGGVTGVPIGGDGQKKIFEEIKSESLHALMKILNSEKQGAQRTPRLKKHEENHTRVHHGNKRNLLQSGQRARRCREARTEADSGGKLPEHKTWGQHLDSTHTENPPKTKTM